jgi:hypothetical protein
MGARTDALPHRQPKEHIMSTRSAIIAKIGGMYQGIYCHFDGYPEGVGAILNKHYRDAPKVSALVSHGDMSSLGERVEPIGRHSFDNPESGTCIYYGRDRGETGCETTIGAAVDSVVEKISHNGYVYVFENGEWAVNGENLADALSPSSEKS